MSATFMRHIENEITKYQRRINRIKAEADPTKLQSNLMLYEIDLEENIEKLAAYKAGKPFGYGHPAILLKGCGFITGGGHTAADRTAQGEGTTRYLNIVREEGWPEFGCDRTVVVITLVTSGDYPKPNFVSVCNESCEFASHNAQALAQFAKCPYFVVDIGNDANDKTLKYVADQFGQEVEYINANVPGAHYDEEELAKLQYYAHQGGKILREIYEFRKRRPCPINPRDAQRETRTAESARYVEYLAAKRDEMFERAEKGVGVMREEKLRLLWTCVGINYDAEIYRWLEEQGVALYYINGSQLRATGLRMGMYGDPWNGRKLTPLEEEARANFYNSWNGRGQRLIDDWRFLIKDQGCDGVVYAMQPGCLPVLNLRKVFADTMEADGVPTLGLEIRGIFSEGYNQRDVKAKLSNFFEVCLAKKQAKELVGAK